MTHAVYRLRAERMERVRKPYVARGSKSVRCERCRLPVDVCICAARPEIATQAAFCLVMHDLEPLRPSNTGWLVADVVAETHAFRWSRTEPDPRLLALLADPAFAPCLVFPADAADPARTIHAVPAAPGRRPLFVILDGTWSEARKMYRKSPWFERFPILSLPADAPSRYRLRRAGDVANLCTAEVATLCLHLAGEPAAAAALDRWFGEFIDVSMRVRGKG